MFSTFDILDKGTVAGMAALGGFAAGTIITAAITTLIKDSAIEEEERKRNQMSLYDLTNHVGTKGNYNVFETYKKNLNKFLKIFQEHYGLDKRNEFEKMVLGNALYNKSDQDDKVIIPDLSKGLLKRNNKLKGSGADRAIMNIFADYKKAKFVNKKGIDIYVAMMQILQNIIILYNEFLNEERSLPEYIDINSAEPGKPKISKLQAVNNAMVEFVKALGSTNMFTDGFKLFGATKREMNLPKIYEMIEDMGNEAVRYQKQASFFKRSNLKFKKILYASFDFAQSLERMSENHIYHLEGCDNYILYNRKDGVVSTNIHSRDNNRDEKDDIMAKLFVRHMSNTHATFLANTPEFNGNYSHLEYLINITDENLYETENQEGSFYLPRITRLTTSEEEFSSPLTENHLKPLMSDINRYLKFMNIAAAMQADLSFRLDQYGSRGLAETGELQYRCQLIDIFIKRAKQIANSSLLGEDSYFRSFIKRTNNNNIINQAKDDPLIGYPYLNSEDKANENYTQSIRNEVFDIPLNDMLHAESLRMASIEYADIETIDKQFLLLMKSYNPAESTKDEGINNQFLFNVCLASQDEELQNDILAIQSPLKAKKILDGYIQKLKDINLEFEKAFNHYKFPERTIFGNDKVFIPTNDDTTLFTSDKVYGKFQDFMKNMAKPKNNPLFTINSEGKYDVIKSRFQNRDSITRFAARINDFILKFNASFENELKGKNQFLLKFRERFVNLANDVNQLGNEVNMTEVAREKMIREQQRIEFEKTLSTLCAEHDAKTNELIRKIEKYQGEHKRIIEKLFSKNNRIFKGFINTVRSHTDQYNTILTDAAVKMKTKTDNFFESVDEELKQFTDAESALFLDIDEMLANIDKQNLNSENIQSINEHLLAHIDKLSNLLNETLPEIINKILTTIIFSTKTMNEKYEHAIQNHETTIIQLETNHQLVLQENENAKSSILELKEQVKGLEEKSTRASTELSRQKISINNVDRELRNLGELTAGLMSIIEGHDYKKARQKLQPGISKILNAGKENLKTRYNENHAEVDAEMNELFSNYDTVMNMVKITEEKSPAILAKINEIIFINKITLDTNSSVSESITEISESLQKQKKYILDLEGQISRLREMYAEARNDLIARLKSDIRELKEQKQEISTLNTIIREEKTKYETIMVKQTESLNKELDLLKADNKELLNKNIELSKKNAELETKLQSKMEASENSRANFANIIRNDETILRKSDLGIFSELLTQIKATQKNMDDDGQSSLKELMKNQTEASAILAKNDRTLIPVKTEISEIDKENTSADQSSRLIILKSCCSNIVTRLLDIHKERLELDKVNGEQKIRWLETIATELDDKNLSSKKFIDVFKTFMILSLENKSGNGFFNWPWTTMGRSLVNEINRDINQPLRELFFNTEDTISYAELAGKLWCEESAIAKAKYLIHGQNTDIDLTIHRFSPAKSGLDTRELQAELRCENQAAESNQSTKQLSQDKTKLEQVLVERDQTIEEITKKREEENNTFTTQLLQKKMKIEQLRAKHDKNTVTISKKTNKMVKSSNEQIEVVKLPSLPSASSFSPGNPFLDNNLFSPGNPFLRCEKEKIIDLSNTSTVKVC